MAEPGPLPVQQTPEGVRLASFPPPERWDDWVEFDPKAWPRRVPRRYQLVPTVCFNCEAACGLLAYVDKETFEVKKLEGNPAHPGSRGRNCAKGPATLNQVNDPERILYPLRRAGRRGEGKWVRVTWDEVLDDIAGRMRELFKAGRYTEVIYHVGRPGHDGYMERVLQSWGVDGHNSHTNVCSSAARAGYAFWMGYDRPSPDHANARVILLLSSHLETGHYFNPHAQRIIEAKERGAKLIVIDSRLSNTAAKADYWLAPWPGSEAAILLAIANHLIQTRRYDREFVRRWVNWDEYLRAEHPEDPLTFEAFEARLRQLYKDFTFEFAERESGVPAGLIREVAGVVAGCDGRLSTHIWRNAAAGNLGGWMVARCLFFLNVLTGSIGRPGGVSANAWDKWVARPFKVPPPQRVWNELLWPREYPLAFFELSYLLPHFLKEGRGRVSVYFFRVYNPVWTNPDGLSWVEALRDESKFGLVVALSPTWSETAWFADYVLPMGHGTERHDLMSQETHAGTWVGFRQPVRRVALAKAGRQVNFTYEVNPGEVWEEDEFWIELSWRIDPDGSLGIRRYYESPYRPGEKVTVDEYYRWIFENSIPGLPEAAAREGLTPLEYMRKYGAFLIRPGPNPEFLESPPPEELAGAEIDPETGIVYSRTPPKPGPNIVPRPAFLPDERGRRPVGVEVDGQIYWGFPTPSRKLEFYSTTLRDWGWPEYAVPTYIKSHVHPENLGRDELVLMPNFRLPTLIHTRSANAKWLVELSHRNPLWVNPEDARRLGIKTGDLVKVHTEIGYFVLRAWVTEGIRPGVVGCSHHIGRWRLDPEVGTNKIASALADLEELGPGRWRLRQRQGVKPFKSPDPDTERLWWEDAGVNQNLAFPVQPDPISGQHCWHQKVRLEKAGPDDRYGDIVVDTNRAMAVYRRWLGLARPARGPLRRPYWLLRPYRPAPEAYRLPDSP